MTIALETIGELHAHLYALDVALRRETRNSMAKLASGAAINVCLREIETEALELPLAGVTLIADKAFAELTTLQTRLSLEERRVVVRYGRSLLQPYFLQSRFLRRVVDKPLGYPGDYGVVEMMFEAHDEGDTALGKILARYVRQTGPARAHRSRVPWILGHLRRRAQELGSRPLRVLSFACGPEQALRQSVYEGDRVEITLVDFDQAALDFCRRKFQEIAESTGHAPPLQRLRLSAYRLLNQPSAVEQLRAAGGEHGFDVVVVAGLLDYLEDDVAGHLVETLASLLAEGGQCLLTNLHIENPWRIAMETILDWTVIHRQREDLGRIMRGCSTPMEITELITDHTGTNIFLAGRKCRSAPWPRP